MQARVLRTPIDFLRAIARCMAVPMSAGLWATSMPAASRAAIFSARRSLAARDDRAGVSHPLARRGRAAGDERGHRLGDVLADEGGGFLLGLAADFAHHHDRLRCPDRPGTASSRSMNDVPTIGSPPRPTQVDWPSPRWSAARPPRRSACRGGSSRRPAPACGCSRA